MWSSHLGALKGNSTVNHFQSARARVFKIPSTFQHSFHKYRLTALHKTNFDKTLKNLIVQLHTAHQNINCCFYEAEKEL